MPFVGHHAVAAATRLVLSCAEKWFHDAMSVVRDGTRSVTCSAGRRAQRLREKTITTRARRHRHGEVGARQVEQVARLLEDADAAQLRVVVVHQPAAVLLAEDLPYVMPVQGLLRPVWVVQKGTAVSSRLRQGVPNSVNLVRWGGGLKPGCCRIEQWDYSASRQAFGLAKVSEVRPARPGPAASATLPASRAT